MKNSLREAREFYNQKHIENKLTQAGLARIVGVSRETIVQLEKGNIVPRVDLAIKLRRALKLRSVESLFIVPLK